MVYRRCDLWAEVMKDLSPLTSVTGQKWGKDEWTPQWIIEHYGPATWNPNKLLSGAREPMYNLNHI